MKIYIYICSVLFLIFQITESIMKPKIIIWDNDGTVMRPGNSYTVRERILPNVESVMRQPDTINIICSGIKNQETESQNYDPEMVIQKFKILMTELPISIAVFSPAIRGTECWVMIKKENDFDIIKAHDDVRYKHLIGKFKKPDTGMLAVIADLLNKSGMQCDHANTLFIGDMWQDMQAAHNFKLSFLHAGHIHAAQDDCYWEHALHHQHGKDFIDAWQDCMQSVKITTSKEQIFHLSVKAIIRNQHNEVLILKRPNVPEEDWDLPGGRININEKPLDALIREVREETGIIDLEQIKAHEIELTTVKVNSKLHQENIRLLVWYHSCFAPHAHITLSDEHIAYAWVSWDVARAKIFPLGQYIDVAHVLPTLILQTIKDTHDITKNA